MAILKHENLSLKDYYILHCMREIGFGNPITVPDILASVEVPDVELTQQYVLYFVNRFCISGYLEKEENPNAKKVVYTLTAMGAMFVEVAFRKLGTFVSRININVDEATQRKKEELGKIIDELTVIKNTL